MKENRYWYWFLRGIGLLLLLYAVRALLVATGHQHIPPQFFFSVSCGVFFGACLLFGGFHLKRLCMLSGALSVLSLFGLDIVRWWTSQKSLADVLMTWGTIAGIFVICVFILVR